MAEEKNKKTDEVKDLQNQVEAMQKLLNHYMNKANQLEQQLVLNQEELIQIIMKVVVTILTWPSQNTHL